MAIQEHLDIIKQGVDVWNKWRKEHREVIRPDLSGADLSGVYLRRARLDGARLSRTRFKSSDLSRTVLKGAFLFRAKLIETNLIEANLTEANLQSAYLYRADLSGAYLRRTDLSGAKLNRANLSGADLNGAILRRTDLTSTKLNRANLSGADLNGAILSGADLSEANLSGAGFIGTNLTNAILTDCRIYGISAWDVQLDEAIQLNLTITPENQPIITVDNLKVAQFIYLLLNNSEIREVIDTIAKKAVLILGRFTPERKRVLDALRETLRTHGYLPILFDFEKPTSRDITETVSTLAHLARFVIADITDAKSIPQELSMIVPNLPSVPIQPLILNEQHEYGMFEHFIRYPWVLPIYRYMDEGSLLASLNEKVIAPAEEKTKELEKR